jgi:flagellar biosynthetic protein FlhB
MPDRSEKTEQPTPKRLKKARKEGKVPRTDELSSMLVIAFFLVFGFLFGGPWMGRLVGTFRHAISNCSHPDFTQSELIVVLGSYLMTAGLLAAGPIFAFSTAGLTGKLVQGVPAMTLKPLKPDITRINPVKGFKKIFSVGKLVETLKILLKLILYTTICYFAAKHVIIDSMAGSPGAEGTVAAIIAVARQMFLGVVALAALIAVVDLLFQRWNHKRGLKMTKKEVKDERKELEGDPHIKVKIRQKQLSYVRSRMMADVPDSTVVVTNPTHVAVALRFVPGEMQVPKVLAKGRAKLAERIKEIAREHRVPIVEDPPLARALYKAVPIGSEIPAALFRAVAEVLAMVLRPGRAARSGNTRREAGP